MAMLNEEKYLKLMIAVMVAMLIGICEVYVLDLEIANQNKEILKRLENVIKKNQTN